METEQAVRTRRSARAFLPKPIDEELLREIVRLSFEAPSWSNIQPYRLALATGETWRRLSAEILELGQTKTIAPEIPWPLKYPSPYKERRGGAGYGLYGVLGIERDDHAARQAQFLKNYRGFGAPAAIFVFVDRRIGEYAVLDVGCWLATLLLVARDRGLDTIAQAALAGYPAVVRDYFHVPDDLGLLCGVSLGYSDPDDPVNVFRPERASLEEILIEEAGK